MMLVSLIDKMFYEFQVLWSGRRMIDFDSRLSWTRKLWNWIALVKRPSCVLASLGILEVRMSCDMVVEI